jgi:hypothetical protein
MSDNPVLPARSYARQNNPMDDLASVAVVIWPSDARECLGKHLAGY